MADLKQKRWIAVAKAGEILPGKPKIVEAARTRIALFKVDPDVGANQGLYAIEDVCTHDDGPVAEGPVEGSVIECPRHGARFDIKTGAVLCMPAITPVRTFPLRVAGDTVEIEVEE